MINTLTYREALRAFADGKTLEELGVNRWYEVRWIIQPPGHFDLDRPSPYRIRQATININGVEVPEPCRTAPRVGDVVWFPVPFDEQLVDSFLWDGCEAELVVLNFGMYHLTREAAEAHARALILASGGQV